MTEKSLEKILTSTNTKLDKLLSQKDKKNHLHDHRIAALRRIEEGCELLEDLRMSISENEVTSLAENAINNIITTLKGTI